MAAICKQCGAPLEEGNKFCMTCGAPAEAATAQSAQPQQSQAYQASQPQQAYTAQQTYQVPQQPAGKQQKQKKQKTVYIDPNAPGPNSPYEPITTKGYIDYLTTTADTQNWFVLFSHFTNHSKFEFIICATNRNNRAFCFFTVEQRGYVCTTRYQITIQTVRKLHVFFDIFAGWEDHRDTACIKDRLYISIIDFINSASMA